MKWEELSSGLGKAALTPPTLCPQTLTMGNVVSTRTYEKAT